MKPARGAPVLPGGIKRRRFCKRFLFVYLYESVQVRGGFDPLYKILNGTHACAGAVQ